MGFLSRATAITRYRPAEPATMDLLRQIPELLVRNGFRSIDHIPDTFTQGWVNFDDPTDSEWRASAPEILSHFVFTLRIDRRQVPPTLLDVRVRDRIKSFLERKKKEMKEKVLIPYAKKDEIKEIREIVKRALLSQAAPVPTMTDVVWLSSGEIWLCSTSPRIREAFDFLFSFTFGLKPIPVDPQTVLPPDAPVPFRLGPSFLTWLYGHDGDALDVDGRDAIFNFDRVVVSDNEGDTRLVTTGEDVPEIRLALSNSHLVTEADITLTLKGDGYSLKVGSDFSMRVLPMFWNRDKEDPDGTFEEKLLSIERVFEVWDALYRLWLIQTNRLPAPADAEKRTPRPKVAKVRLGEDRKVVGFTMFGPVVAPADIHDGEGKEVETTMANPSTPVEVRLGDDAKISGIAVAAKGKATPKGKGKATPKGKEKATPKGQGKAKTAPKEKDSAEVSS